MPLNIFIFIFVYVLVLSFTQFILSYKYRNTNKGPRNMIYNGHSLLPFCIITHAFEVQVYRIV